MYIQKIILNQFNHDIGFAELIAPFTILLLQFLQACQWEKDDGIKKSLFKKAKYLATIEKAMISTDVELTAEDLLKRIVNKAGGALMKVNTAFPCAILVYPVSSISCIVCVHTTT